VAGRVICLSIVNADLGADHLHTEPFMIALALRLMRAYSCWNPDCEGLLLRS